VSRPSCFLLGLVAGAVLAFLAVGACVARAVTVVLERREGAE